MYEFWSKRYAGVVQGKLSLPAMGPMTVQSYSIRVMVDHPQLVSTNRHLSQGAVDLLSMKWGGNALSGRSAVIAEDRYELAIHVPKGFAVKQATINRQPATVTSDGPLTRVSFVPQRTGEVDWLVTFNVVP